MDRYSFVLNSGIVAVNLLMMLSVGLTLEPRHFVALSRIKSSLFVLFSAQALIQRERLVVFWRPTVAGVSLLLLLATCVGAAVGIFLQLPRKQLVGGTMIFPVRNVGLAAAIAGSLLGRLDYVPIAVIFFWFRYRYC